MPFRPASPCPRCHRLGGCACARTSPRNHGGLSAAVRGYGREHQAERAAWAEDVGEWLVACARCHQPIVAGEAWDLGHSDDRMSTAPEHRRCNRAAPRLANKAFSAALADRSAQLLAHPQNGSVS
jgi:hypothetical protein